MATSQDFRSAFNGFNREDVVRYIEYLNAKHTAEVNQLTTEADFLRQKLAAQGDADGLSAAIVERDRQIEEQAAQIEALKERCAELEKNPPREAAPQQELEAYRRAERTERLARERAEQIYRQTNGALADATARVDEAAAEIGDMTDLVSRQLAQLQAAVTSSKQALKEAAATMYALRPDSTGEDA